MIQSLQPRTIIVFYRSTTRMTHIHPVYHAVNCVVQDRVKFRAFKQQYRPAGYATRAEEHARFQVFRSNLDLIAAANSDPRLTYTLGVDSRIP